MSSSISLNTSADLETLTSIDISKDEAIFKRKYKRGDASTTPKVFIEYGSRLSKSPLRQFGHSSAKLSNSANYIKGNLDDLDKFRVGSSNFYQEVDERMSRNSVEYPEQQAKYVDRWLNDTDFSKSVSVDSTCHNGNVIGIRGFPTKLNSSNEGEQRAKFNKLKFNYSKLQSDYDKLRAQLGSCVEKFKRLLKKRDNDINVLKAFIREKREKKSIELDQVHKNCCCENRSLHKSSRDLHDTNEEELAKLQHGIRLLELKMSSKEKEHEVQIKTLLTENDHLKSQSELTKSQLDKELVRMRNQVQTLSLEPNNKLVISLRNENSRLKDADEIRGIEFQALKENYQKLELKLQSLVNEHLNEDKNDEISKLMVELCRLQVYQPKLEATLETERAIKSELQKRIDSLIEDNDNLRNQLDDQKLELNRIQFSQSKKIESAELDVLQKELAQWNDKYYRLKKEKSDIEELLRVWKSKVASIDSRHKSEIDLVRETNQCEIKELSEKNLRLENQCNSLISRLKVIERKSEELTLDNNKLSQEVMELNKRLLEQRSDEATLRKLEDNEKHIVTLRRQLELAESKNREKVKEHELMRGQLVRSKQQVEQFRERFKVQQQTLDEMKDKRDKELAKLRVSLNFERYNKQVALKGIEKELRCSLKELEAMKYRFSRRLAQNEQPIGIGACGREGNCVISKNGSSTTSNSVANKSASQAPANKSID